MKSGRMLPYLVLFLLTHFPASAETTWKNDKFSLAWKIEGDRIEITMSAQTTGWIAAGFSPDMMMKGANIVIGYVKGGKVSVRDDFGNSLISHKDDETIKGGKNDVTVISGTEANGWTEITFSMQLDSGDMYDKPIVPSIKTSVIIAYGSGDNFTSPHRYRDTVSITF